MWGNAYYGYPMMGYGYGSFGVAHAIFSVIWVVILIVVIVAAIRWVRRGGMGPWHSYSEHSALNILKERYAKGEIDKAEYEERKKVLSD